MNRSTARTRDSWVTRRTVVLCSLFTFISFSGRAAGEPSCAKYTVHELSPGMSHELVRLRMGGDGVKTVIRIPGSDEASGVDYPGPSFDVYVQYDHRIDRRPPARAVLVRTTMPMSLDAVQALVDRFGLPLVGADDLVTGLREHAAVWVDRGCGVVLSAYRPHASWWTAEDGVALQLETLDHARTGDSPASSFLEAMDGRTNPAAIAPEPAPVPGQLMIQLTIDAPSSVPGDRSDEEPSGSSDGIDGASAPPADRPAERLEAAPPVYPVEAKGSGIKGHVTLDIVVRADGSVAAGPRVVAARPAGRGFERAAIEAVRTWRYEPATRGGRPVESDLTIDVDVE